MIQRFKRYLALLLALLLVFPLCFGCAKKDGSDKLQILCTVFPLYDWVKNVVGDSETVEVSLLVSSGSDLHSYQPSAEDMMKIASADLFFFVGGPSDAWIEEALQTQASETRVDINMTEIPEIRLREICSDSADEHHGHEHGALDEHLWLSLENAMIASSYVCEILCELDETAAESYRNNLTNYEASLHSLDEEYTQMVAAVRDPMILCADRFPFVYLAEDYGIRYISAFEGCSTDANATPDTVLRLANALDEYGLQAIVVTERSDEQLAKSIRAASRSKDQVILSLDSMQSVTGEEIEEGTSYLTIMKKNLETLRQALTS